MGIADKNRFESREVRCAYAVFSGIASRPEDADRQSASREARNRLADETDETVEALAAICREDGAEARLFGALGLAANRREALLEALTADPFATGRRLNRARAASLAR